MGYTTEFRGKFKLNKKLSQEDHEYLQKFSESRRMARNIEGFGVEGEFYVDGGDDFFAERDKNIINYNTPPKTQPGLWCQWVPTEDGMGIEWDGNEKFYNYVEWLEYLIKNILEPRGYVLNGVVEWRGEDFGDTGEIIVEYNKVSTETI